MSVTAQRPVRRFQRCYFVYILASLRGTLYTGLTDDLRKRIMQHKEGLFDGFTRKYKVDCLMYFESFSGPKLAAQREKQIKGYRREKKIALSKDSNPQWRNVTPEIFQTIGSRPLSKVPNAATRGIPTRRGYRAMSAKAKQHSYSGDPSVRSGPSPSQAQGRDFRKKCRRHGVGILEIKERACRSKPSCCYWYL
jgi:putative endonuclease